VCRKITFLVSKILMTAFPVAIASPPSYTELLVYRKNTFLLSLILVTACGLAASFAPSYQGNKNDPRRNQYLFPSQYNRSIPRTVDPH
jgi:hypothetical protein